MFVQIIFEFSTFQRFPNQNLKKIINRFDEFFRELFDSDGLKMGFPRPRELKISRSLLIPKRGSVFDYVYAKKTYGSWHRWANFTKSPDLSDSTKVSWNRFVVKVFIVYVIVLTVIMLFKVFLFSMYFTNGTK